MLRPYNLFIHIGGHGVPCPYKITWRSLRLGGSIFRLALGNFQRIGRESGLLRINQTVGDFGIQWILRLA